MLFKDARVNGQWVLALVLVAGCSDGSSSKPDAAGPLVFHEERGTGTPIAPFTECIITTYTQGFAGRDHRDPCSELTYELHPPIGGPHYSRWADFRIYDAPVPFGFLVHSMEHGGVALLYNCDEECQDAKDFFVSLKNTHVDNACARDPQNRYIVMPDPALEVPIAAAAWGAGYRATCFDQPSLERFFQEHYARGPEELCAPGVDLRAQSWCGTPDAGMPDASITDDAGVSFDASTTDTNEGLDASLPAP